MLPALLNTRGMLLAACCPADHTPVRYFAPHHVEEMEPQCPSKFSFDFEFEAGEDADTDYKALIWDEVLKFHPECR